jgi:phosphopantothenoylcysteine decarboxylase / phosphopantothenate---cysteine ligase
VVRIDSAEEMLAACLKVGRVDVAVCAAAVADWKMARPAAAKIKKKPGAAPPSLELAPNPDILATLSRPGPERPALVIGFAAETEDLVANAIDKRKRKGCDWIVANDVSPATGVMGGDRNTIHLLTREGDGPGAGVKLESWPAMTKEQVASALVGRIAERVSAGERS